MSNHMGLNICDTNSKLFSDLARELQKDGRFQKLKGLAEELCGMELKVDIPSARSEAEMLLLLLGDFGCDMATLASLLEQLELWSCLALVKYEPLVLQEDLHVRELWVRLQSHLRLSCKASGYPPPKYEWCKDGRSLAEKDKGDFVIEKIRPADVGTYSCNITQCGIEGPQVHTQSVLVNIVPQKPKIVAQPCLQTCGAQRYLDIETEAYPSSWFLWHRDGSPVNEKSLQSVYELPLEGNSHDGLFSCLVGNDEGTVWSDSVQVDDDNVEQTEKPFVARDKVALLIGNSYYKSHPLLPSAYYDVVTLADHLEALSFRVLALNNLNLVEMKNIVETVASNLREGSYVLIYYGGHGFSFYGNDYLLPVDAPSNGLYKCSDSIDKEEIVSVLSQSKPALLAIFLDMCRKTPSEEENPFLYSERPRVYRYEPQRNLIYGFSTTTNLSAFELSNEKNGIFMKYLQKHIRRKIPVRQLLAEVQAEILREPSAAARLQMPSVTNNLAEDISLTDRIQSSVASNVDAFWNEINQLPGTQTCNLSQGGKLQVEFSKRSRHFLNSIEMMILCEKIRSGLLLRSSSDDITLATEIVDQSKNGCSCRVFIDDIQRLKNPVEINIFVSNDIYSDPVPIATINLGSPLISCLKLSVNKL